MIVHVKCRGENVVILNDVIDSRVSPDRDIPDTWMLTISQKDGDRATFTYSDIVWVRKFADRPPTKQDMVPWSIIQAMRTWVQYWDAAGCKPQGPISKQLYDAIKRWDV